LLVASNNSEPKHAKEFLGFLSKFIKDGSEESREKLIEIAIKQIYFRKVSVGTKERSFKKKKLKILCWKNLKNW
jgi:hypothetical protein